MPKCTEKAYTSIIPKGMQVKKRFALALVRHSHKHITAEGVAV